MNRKLCMSDCKVVWQTKSWYIIPNHAVKLRAAITQVIYGPVNEVLNQYAYKKLRGFSPQANYTDRAIAAGQRS
jgi:hypothetical protein